MGVAAHAAGLIVAALRRDAGMVLICGPTGVGKTTLAELLVRELHVPFLGDLRRPDEVARGLRRAADDVVLAVVRSGESYGLRERWRDMAVPDALVEGAALMTVTLRRIPGSRTAEHSYDLLLVEVIGSDGRLLTKSLAEEAKALVASGVLGDDRARVHVPGYE